MVNRLPLICFGQHVRRMQISLASIVHSRPSTILPSRTLTTISRFPTLTTRTIMAKVYAKDQPQGFSNRIEKVAIVGVRHASTPVKTAISNSLVTG